MDILIDKWELGLRAGTELTAEELTADCPELLKELKKEIEAIKDADNFFNQLLNKTDFFKDFERYPKEYPLPKIIDNKYRLKKKIGAGHFGLVWLAEDIALERDVAIKFPTYHILSDVDKVTQFKNEAKLLAELSNASQHIVEVKGLGIISPQNSIIDEVPYFVMELMTTTLDKHNYDWREKPLEVASVVAKLADALHGIHIYKSGKLIHRDIKPNNIFTKTCADDSFQVKLGDFGLALDPNIDPNDIDNHYGSINYMAPEILTKQPASVRSDLYSLGVVFYFMLTGVEPFPSESGQTRLVDNLVHGKMLPPATVNVHLNDFLPLQDVCLKAMSVKPDDRYDNAKQFAGALREAIKKITKNEDVNQNIKVMKNRKTNFFLIIFSFALSIVSINLWLRSNSQNPHYQQPANKLFNNLLNEKTTVNEEIKKKVIVMQKAGEKIKKVQANPYLRTDGELDLVKKVKALANDVIEKDSGNKAAEILKVKCNAILKEKEIGEEIYNFNEHREAVRDVAMTPDAKWGLSAGADCWIILWNLAMGKCERKLYGHTAPIRSVAISNDGRFAVSGSDKPESAIRMWDLKTGENLWTDKSHKQGILQVCFSAGGEYIAIAGGMDRTARVVKAKTGKDVASFRVASRVVARVCFSKNGKKLVVGTQIGKPEAQVWDISNKTRDWSFSIDAGIRYVSTTMNNKYLLMAGSGQYTLWDVNSKSAVVSVDKSTTTPYPDLWSSSSSATGEKIIHGYEEKKNSAVVCNMKKKGAPVLYLIGHSAPVSSTAISAAGEYALTGSKDMSVRLWYLGDKIKNENTLFVTPLRLPKNSGLVHQKEKRTTFPVRESYLKKLERRVVTSVLYFENPPPPYFPKDPNSLIIEKVSEEERQRNRKKAILEMKKNLEF